MYWLYLTRPRKKYQDFFEEQLDRKVVGKTPLKFRSQGTVSEGEDLVVIGHPTGLPTKIADGARVKSVSKKPKYSFSSSVLLINSFICLFFWSISWSSIF